MLIVACHNVNNYDNYIIHVNKCCLYATDHWSACLKTLLNLYQERRYFDNRTDKQGKLKRLRPGSPV